MNEKCTPLVVILVGTLDNTSKDFVLMAVNKMYILGGVFLFFTQ
jgi:hypothetical protein